MTDIDKAQRTAILVDVQNLFYSAKSILQSKIDYSKLFKGLSDNKSIIRAIAYVVQRPDVPQGPFIDTLYRIGFDVRIKETKNKTNARGELIPSKGSYCVLMTLDAVELANKVDNVILVSGDGDLTPVVKYLKNHGCRVQIAAFEESISEELARAADGCIFIPDEWTFSDPKFNSAQTQNPQNNEEDFDDERQPDTYQSAGGVMK